jgi:hypothetical protein
MHHFHGDQHAGLATDVIFDWLCVDTTMHLINAAFILFHFPNESYKSPDAIGHYVRIEEQSSTQPQNVFCRLKSVLFRLKYDSAKPAFDKTR